MDQSPKPAKTYLEHRENQRERILEVAERLFISGGIDGVNLSDIARAARMTRNTLYEYFPNKQEVAWGIFQKLIRDWKVTSTDAPLEQAGNGFQRIQAMMMQMVNQLVTDPEHLRFIVEFNTLYAREGSPARVLQVIEQTWSGAYDRFALLIRQGIDDGSIRADLDPQLLSAAIMNLINGMNSRFALLGSRISEEYRQPVNDIYQEICRAFLRGIQSTPSHEEQAE